MVSILLQGSLRFVSSIHVGDVLEHDNIMCHKIINILLKCVIYLYSIFYVHMKNI